MKRSLFIVYGVVAFILVLQVEGFACSCNPPTVGESEKSVVSKARNRAQAVFSGMALQIITDPAKEWVTVKFRVERSWKGSVSKEVNIVTGAHDGNCGIDFKTGEKYLVYASRSSEGGLETGMCDRTDNLRNARKDLKILGKGKITSKSES